MDSVAETSEMNTSQSSILSSQMEFGPVIPQVKDSFSLELSAYLRVPTFKERFDRGMDRLVFESMKFCSSGKLKSPPIIALSIAKHRKCLLLPFYEDMLAFEQSPHGKDAETILDTTFPNPLQLNHSDFEILNSDWDSYLLETVMPLIQCDLRLNIRFKLSFYKMVLYKTGAVFESHRDSEKEDGIFATLIIQLPSKFDGGKLIVRHKDRTEEVDFSSTSNPQNTFSFFYTAFYCDCEYEILPLTSGVRGCLIYNLVNSNNDLSPSAVRLNRDGREADLVQIIRNDWPKNRKIVYCLSQMYTRNSLSFDSLKKTDRIVGEFFKNNANSCGLDVMLAVLKKRQSFETDNRYVLRKDENATGHNCYEISYITDDGTSLDSEDPNILYYNYFQLKHIKSLDDSNDMALRSMHVNFENEVVPTNCFDSVQSFQLGLEETDNIMPMKVYYCAAIVAFRHDDIVPVFVEGDVKPLQLEDIFINDFQKFYQVDNSDVKDKFLEWGHIILNRYLYNMQMYDTNEMKKPSEFLDTLLLLNNVELMQTFLELLKFQPSTFSYLHRICHKYDWDTFSNDITTIFFEVASNHQFDYLKKFIDYVDETHRQDEKQGAIHKIMKKMIFDFEDELKYPLWEKYEGQPPRRLKEKERTEGTIKFLTSLWPLAIKVRFSYLSQYAKSLAIKVVVPVLLEMVDVIVLDDIWFDIAEYFLSKMKEFLENPPAGRFAWSQNVTLSCSCKDCQSIQECLLCPYNRTITFKGELALRAHVEEILQDLENINCFTNRDVLYITKLKKVADIVMEERNFIVSSIIALRRILVTRFKYNPL